MARAREIKVTLVHTYLPMLSHRLESHGITPRRAAIFAGCILFLLILASAGKPSTQLEPSSSSTSQQSNTHNPPQGRPPSSSSSTTTTSEYEIHKPPAAASQITSKTIADELAGALLERIGSGRGPIIEGGIGDSGTRGVRDVLKHLGAVMLDEGHVVTNSKDSLVYMHNYDTISSMNKHVMRAPAGLYNLPIRSRRTLNYNESVLPFDHYHMGRQWVAKMVGKTMTINQGLRASGAKLDPWGFKHPRTALLVPFWHGTLGDKFLFIHVMRDGKDIVEGDNQKVFNDHCGLYYGRHCDDSLRQRLEFWADLNRDIFNYALTSSMKAHQYLAIRIEDLVVGNTQCFRRLAAFIGLDAKTADALVPSAIEANKGHASSYFGHKWTAAIKNKVERNARVDQDAKSALEWWGYSPDSYNFTLGCEELPWMDAMRRAKGQLPGDF